MTLDRQQLDGIKIASPCSASWDGMKGDDQVRFCGQCKLNVYNLSAMSLDEISTLLAKKEGRTCVRFFRRADGTVLTDDCPVGLRAVRRRLAMVAAAVGSLLTAVTAGMWTVRGSMGQTLRESALGRFAAVRAVANWMTPKEPVRIMMGAPMPMPIAPQGRIALPPKTSCSGTVPPSGQREMGKVMRKPVDPREIMGDVTMPTMGEPMPLPSPAAKERR
jgi:hypothetical protein